MLWHGFVAPNGGSEGYGAALVEDEYCGGRLEITSATKAINIPRLPPASLERATRGWLSPLRKLPMSTMSSYLGCFGANLPKLPMNQDPANSDWFYCLEHKTVEPEEGCRAEVRLGPYPTREEAARAIERVDERNEEWDNDPAWNDERDE